MSIKVCSAMLCCYFVLNGACGSKSGTSQNSSPASTPSPAVATSANPASNAEEAKTTVGASTNAPAMSGLDACGLIEKSEIESVQGAKMQETIPGKRDADPLLISQCYYRVLSSDGSKDLSVHLEVTQNGPKSTNQNSVRDLWRERFLGTEDRKDTKEKEEKEMEEMDQLKSVPGIGDGAYWMGNNKGGALYVFRKDKLVRISIGGPDDGEIRIQKTKTLAEKVLKRLS